MKENMLKVYVLSRDGKQRALLNQHQLDLVVDLLNSKLARGKLNDAVLDRLKEKHEVLHFRPMPEG